MENKTVSLEVTPQELIFIQIATDIFSTGKDKFINLGMGGGKESPSLTDMILSAVLISVDLNKLAAKIMTTAMNAKPGFN